MQVQKTQPHNPNFTSAIWAAQALQFLEASPTWGAIAVDIASMTGPRTIIDFVERGPEIGMETGIQQGGCTLNFGLMGPYAMLAGLAAAQGINNKYGIKAHNIFASNDLITEFGEAFHKQLQNNSKSPVSDTLDEILKNLTAVYENNDFRSIREDTRKDIIRFYNEKLGEDKDFLSLNKKDRKEFKEFLRSKIMSETGCENGYVLKNAAGKEAVKKISLDAFIDNTIGITEAFKSRHLKAEFGKNIPVSGIEALNSLNHLARNRSILGIGFALIIGLGIQPLNVYLTKKKTGCDGFVGVKGRSKDKSKEFAAAKTGFAAVALGLILRNIGKFSELGKNLQFKGPIPTLEQFKFIYGAAIVSRLLMTRDKDELREALVRDTVGFVNWLILGGFVTKLTTYWMDKDKSLIKNAGGGIKDFFKWNLLTRDEVLQSRLKKLGVKTVENNKALTFKDLLKKLNEIASGSGNAAKDAKNIQSQLRKISTAQIAGYAYSCIVLGVLLPKLNIYMTRKSEEKLQAKLAEEKHHHHHHHKKAA